MPTGIKTKANQKRLDAALTSFHARYSSPDQYGEQRWNNALIPTLLQPTSYVALVNRFVETDRVAQLFTQAGVVDTHLEQLAFTNALPHDSLSVDNDAPLLCFRRMASGSALQVNKGTEVVGTSSASVLPFPAPSMLSSVLCKGEGLLSHWNMDAASVLAASMLQAQPGDRVLDLCAAPGGKSIVLSHLLFPHLYSNSLTVEAMRLSSDEAVHTSLHCNEIDPQRHKRLTANLQAYLPAELFTSKAVVTLKVDGSAKAAVTSLPYGENGYDKVLIDAPCSSERHILHAHAKATQAGQIAEEMLNWKSSHSLTLAKTQVGLLTNGLLAVRSGGRVVYATCALGREENDLVIETVLGNLKKERKREKTSNSRKKWDWELEFAMGEQGKGHDSDIPLVDEMTEQTKYGRIALPDRGGWGPLYFCVMTKVERKKGGMKPAKGVRPRNTTIEQIDSTVSNLDIHEEQDGVNRDAR